MKYEELKAALSSANITITALENERNSLADRMAEANAYIMKVQREKRDAEELKQLRVQVTQLQARGTELHTENQNLREKLRRSRKRLRHALLAFLAALPLKP